MNASSTKASTDGQTVADDAFCFLTKTAETEPNDSSSRIKTNSRTSSIVVTAEDVITRLIEYNNALSHPLLFQSIM